MAVRVHGKFNCEVCGRFAYAADIDGPEVEKPEFWGAWCKKHLPKNLWIKDDHGRAGAAPGRTGFDSLPPPHEEH